MTDQRTRELEVLAEASRLLTSTLDLGEVLGRLADIACARLGADVVRIWLREEPGDTLRLRAQTGARRPEVPAKDRLSPHESLAGWVMSHRKPLVLDDVLQDPRLTNRKWFEAEGLLSFLCVPIMLDENPIGILACMRRSRREFTPAEVALAEALTAPAVVAVRNAALYAEALERLEEIQAFHRLAADTLASPDLGTALRAVVRELRRLLRSDVAACSLVDAAGRALEVVTTEGARADTSQRFRIQPGAGLASVVLRERRTVRSDDYLADPRFTLTPTLEDWARAEGVVSSIGGPVLAPSGEIIGLLWALNRSRTPFTERHEAMLEGLARQAALAIGQAKSVEETARHYQAARQHASEVEALSAIGESLTSTLDLQKVLEAIADSAATLIGAQRAVVYELDEAAGVLRARAMRGIGIELGLTLRLGQGGAGAAALRLAPTWSGDVLRDPLPGFDESLEPSGLPLGAYIRGHGVRAILAVPVVSRGAALGAVSVYWDEPHEPDEREIRLLSALARQAAIAMDNARLVQDLRRTVDDLGAAQETLVRGATLRAVGELAAGAAHHLNNLMAVVLGRTQLLLMKDFAPTEVLALKSIERAALDAADTVRRIQAFSRTGPAGPATGFDLNAAVREAVELTRPRWEDEAQVRGTPIEVVAELGPLPAAAGWSAEIREVVTNLILNAVDALPHGGRIVISTRAEPDRVLVSVNDTGIGIPADVKRRVFEPFFTTKGVKRTGLGLAVAYGTVRRHAGQIMLDSAEGRGTTVTFWLPVAGEARAEAGPAAVPGKRLGTILVIDDDPNVRELVAEALAAQGHSVTVAAGGREGLERFEAGRYDLVLTDLGMPDLNGWDVARAIKASRAGTPVLLLTGWADLVEPGAVSGVEGILKKPFGLGALAAAVGEALAPRA
jgi:GAF domain-containing protein/anti-sigma regulatory factor (Ser/Thr protein kinase)